MEKLKEKHNHTLTSILKVLTFAIVLLFPFLVFMPSAFYYGFNEHAQIEIPQKVGIYQTNEVNNVNDLVVGNVYHCDELQIKSSEIDGSNTEWALYVVKCDTISFYNYDLELDEVMTTNYDSRNDNSIIFYGYGTENDRFSLTISYTNLNSYIAIYDEEDFIVSIYDFDFYLNNQDELDYFINLFYDNAPYYSGFTYSTFQDYEITETTTISENLSNTWEKMWQTPLFKWTENTPFTATTNAFASVFNISQESGFYNLIAYFITITGIYLIIDIVLGVATWLTHMIGRQD